MSLLDIRQGPTSYNYYVLRGVLDDEVLGEIRAVAAALPDQGGAYSRSSLNRMYAYLDRMPTLYLTLNQLFDDIHIIGSNMFCSEPMDPSAPPLGEWHTGHSLYFGVNGQAMTMWIPLQDLDEETGGRLKMYNGRHISQIDDLLDCQVRNIGNSISNEHSILKFLNEELNEGCTIPDMKAGDLLLFDEMLPHQAENCRIHREAFAVRIVLGEYTLDEEVIEQVLERYRTRPGEIGYARELNQNLLKFGEYQPPGASGRPADIGDDAMPVAELPSKRSIWERARGKLNRAS